MLVYPIILVAKKLLTSEFLDKSRNLRIKEFLERTIGYVKDHFHLAPWTMRQNQSYHAVCQVEHCTAKSTACSARNVSIQTIQGTSEDHCSRP